MIRNWRLATFNLESLDERARAPEEFAARCASLRPLLLELDADILCLQEVNAQGKKHYGPRKFAALTHLMAGTPYSDFHIAYSVNPKTGSPADVHNLVTLSRWPLRQRQVFHDFLPPWMMPAIAVGASARGNEVRFDRPVLIAEIDTPHGRLVSLNLHLRAPRAVPFQTIGRGGRWSSNAEWAEGFHLAALKRQGQALEARLVVERVFDGESRARIAVCGDLNADSFETPSRILRGVPDEGADGSLRERELTLLDQRLPAEQRYSVIHDRRRVMLDHLMVSRALAERCTGVKSFNAGLADEAHVEGQVAGSLHAPLVAEFAEE